MKLCDAYRKQYGSEFISLIPTSTFGPGDSLEIGNGHLISDLLMKALVKKRHLMKTGAVRESIELWGSGSPLREYLYVDDLADAIFFALQHPDTPPLLNVGGGTRFTIKDLAEKIVAMIDERITLKFDASRPDGAPARFLENSVLEKMGWRPTHSFDEGLRKTLDWYQANIS
ncbi:MAG: NAD-dependent epimerase/dehydratase family protein [Oxalobacteraceae bacterium]|nr:NAD-dependent epimerase/dehydratase family protein [Oxalobacteraceae bacterium]